MLIELLVLAILVKTAISERCPPGIVGVHRVIGMHRRLTGARGRGMLKVSEASLLLLLLLSLPLLLSSAVELSHHCLQQLSLAVQNHSQVLALIVDARHRQRKLLPVFLGYAELGLLMCRKLDEHNPESTSAGLVYLRLERQYSTMCPKMSSEVLVWYQGRKAEHEDTRRRWWAGRVSVPL